MQPIEPNTKRTLIEAAGPLFAEHGIDGTTVRAIAEKAQTNIAAINYHFGSKENLYKETLLFVAKRGETYPALRLLERPGLLKSRDDQANAIREIIREKFRVIFAQDTPAWYWKLMIRSMLESSNPAIEAVVRTVFEPEHKAITRIVKMVKPEVDEEAAHMWGFLLFGAISFYCFAKTPILLLLNREEYAESFIESATNFVSEALLKAFELS